MALLQDLASRYDVPAKSGRDPARERRDIQRAIDLWQQNVSEPGCPPAFGTFDFSPMKGDWAYRFLICSDETAANSAFLIYGSKFAGLLKLPKARLGVASIEQLPDRYRHLFVTGCSKAMAQQAPARLSGSCKHESQIELYRAVFMPIMLQRSWLKQLIFGSFNFRTVNTTVEQTAS